MILINCVPDKPYLLFPICFYKELHMHKILGYRPCLEKKKKDDIIYHFNILMFWGYHQAVLLLAKITIDGIFLFQ